MKDKIVIIGSMGDMGISALYAEAKKNDLEVELVSADFAKNFQVVDLKPKIPLFNITVPEYFQPPITRKERRKLNRNK